MFGTDKVCRAITKALSGVFIAVVVVLAFLLVGIRLVGYTPYIVLSGSMEPTYHVGSVVYVVEVDPYELKEGDPLTFVMDGGIVVTHRIIEVKNADDVSAMCFITQGDANNMADGGAVYPSDVIGVPKFTIPYLGYVSDFVQKPQGLFAVVGACVAVMLISFAVDALLTRKEEAKPEKASEDSEDENGN